MKRTRERRSWWTWALLILGAVSLSTTAWAQALRNGSIAGTITDNTGGALPGVTITVTSPALQLSQLVKVSEANGTYQIVDLPVGTYRVTYELPGFSTLVREDIRLTTAFAARVDVVLPVATVAETITVTGESPLVDVTNTRGGTTVTQELIASTPTNLNNQGVFALAGGVFLARTNPLSNAVGGQNLPAGIIAYGQQVRMGLWLEGVKATQSDVPDYAATEEVDVKSFGNTAEIDLPGAAFNLIYRSGGNQFHGRLSGEYQNERVQWDNVDDALRRQGISAANAPKYLRKAGGDLGGRIIRNKLWFFVARMWEDSEKGLTGFANDPGPDGEYLTADDTPGFPWTRGANWTGKFSYQPTSRHRFIAYGERQKQDDEDKTGSRLIPHEASRWSTTWSRHSKVEWQGVLSTSLLASMMVGETGYHIMNRPHVASTPGERTPLPITPCRFYRDTQLYTGNGCGGFTLTSASGSANAAWLDRSPHRKQFAGTLTYDPHWSFLGSHNFTAGYLYLPGRMYVDAPDSGISSRYLLVYDRVAGAPYRPAEFWAADVPTAGGSRQNVFGTYLADEWKLTKRLTVNAGLRWERTVAYVEPQVKAQGTFGFAGTYPKVDIGTWSGLAPRLGGAFDLLGDGKTVVKGTFGIFNHSEFNNFGNPITFTSPFNKNSPTQYKYQWRDQDGNNDYTPGEVNLDVNGPSFLSVAGPANNLVNPDLEWGRTHEMSASVEREVVANISVRGLYVFKRIVQETSSQTFINVLRPYSVWNRAFTRRDPGPDGALNTADDGARVTVYDYDPAYRGAAFVANMLPNVPRDRSDMFHNLEVRLTKRPGTGKWYAHTSFLATKNHRWLDAIAETPNSDYFPLDETWDKTYLLAGGYDLPYGVSVSTLYQIFSGTKGQRTTIYRAADPDGGPTMPSSSTITLRSGPSGEVGLPTRHLMNIRFSKRLAVGGGRKLTITLDAYNVLNTNVAFAATYLSGPTFGYATTIAPPRALRFGSKFEF